MCTKNYILLNRNLLVNDLWNSEPFTRGQAWVDLLLNTNWKDSIAIIKGVSIPVKRGQVCRSIKQLSIRWKWSEGKVKRYLELLVELHQITFETCGKNGAANGAAKTGITTLITITNYNSYQIDGAANGAQTERKQSADGAQTETYKKGKEGEEGKEKQLPTVSDVSSLYRKYAGVNQVNGGQVVVFQDFIKIFSLEAIEESFQAAAASSIPVKAFLNWCKTRMERTRDAPAPAVADDDGEKQVAYLKSLGCI